MWIRRLERVILREVGLVELVGHGARGCLGERSGR